MSIDPQDVVQYLRALSDELLDRVVAMGRAGLTSSAGSELRMNADMLNDAVRIVRIELGEVKSRAQLRHEQMEALTRLDESLADGGEVLDPELREPGKDEL